MTGHSGLMINVQVICVDMNALVLFGLVKLDISLEGLLQAQFLYFG